jgi:hypothetical protein
LFAHAYICVDDLDEDDYSFPTFGKAFGSTATPESKNPYSHRSQASSSSDISYARPHASSQASPSADPTPSSITPTRPILPKAPVSYAYGTPTPPTQHPHAFGEGRLGKFSNGSSSSLAGATGSISGSSYGTSAGFLANKKGSLASLKNAFKGSGSTPIPPVPTLDTRVGAPGLPALRNPFSRFEAPVSPTASSFRPNAPYSRSSKPSISSTAPSAYTSERNPSNPNVHSSQRSYGAQSNTSQGSSNFRADDHPLPNLPKIPSRARAGRGSGSGSLLGLGRNGSMGGDQDDLGGNGPLGRTPGEEALRVVFTDFKESANKLISTICSKALVSLRGTCTVYEVSPADKSRIRNLPCPLISVQASRPLSTVC